jgi:hypothetical protein
MILRNYRPQSLASAALLLVFSASGGLANTFTFTGSSGGVTVSAQADVTLSGNTATVVLRNLQTDVGAAGQLISGFGFVVKNSGGTVLTESGVVSEQGVVRTLSDDGTGDQSFIDGSLTTIDWSVQNSQNSPISTNCNNLVGIQLCALTGASPDLMIVGPPAGDGDYSVNPSVFPNHQPDLAPSSTKFVITLSGTGAFVTGANFTFGTGSDSTTPNVAGPTPEPRWTGLLLTLVGGLVAFVFRRFKSVGA